MSYFDHVRCPECRAAFDPERVESRGGVMACPYCGAGLKLANLFGLSAAFAEQETPELGLDDLIPEGDRDVTWFGHTATGQYVDREAHLRGEREVRGDGGAPSGFQGATVSRSAAPARPDGRNLPARRPSRGAGPADGASGGSALDVLRQLKKK